MTHAPIRGTQSFVGVMSEVWHRPLLTAIEAVSRWIAWLPALWCLSWMLGTHGIGVQLSTQWLATFVAEVQVWFLEVIHGSLKLSFDSSVLSSSFFLAITAAALWGVLSGHGRSILLRRIDAQLIPRRLTLCLLAAVRVALFITLIALWLAALTLAWIHFVQGPQSLGQYPDYVPGFALLIVLTLAMFVLWASTSWIFRLASVLAMAHRLNFTAALRAAWNAGPLRAKLVEINLVMGVVKVGLIVWSLALSSCPLPFANNETQDFLNWWWFGTFVMWVFASDYFHVVRQASYLRLAQAYDFVPRETPASLESAS